MSDWQKQRTMTGLQFKRIIKVLGMSQAGAGRFVGASERTARRYISGEAEIPTSVALLLRSMVHHADKPVVPAWSKEGN